MPNLGGWEWGIILFIIILLFGLGKLPKAMGDLGKSLKEFRKAIQEESNE